MAQISNKGKINTKRIVMLAMLCAISYVLTVLSELLPPIVPAVSFLEYDPKDIIIALGGFMFGPLSAVFVSLIVSFIEMISISTTGPVGFLMNVLSTCAFVCPAALIYKRKHSLSSAIIGLVIGGISMTGMMLLWNYIITPIYYKMPREAVVALMLPGFLPFNLIKSGLNIAVTILVYKPVVTALRKSKLLPESTSPRKAGKKYLNAGVMLFAAVLLATCVLLILVYKGVI